MTTKEISRPHHFRRLAFLLIAAFMVIAPSLPQVFGVYSILFRPWTMYSAVGLGLLKGAFVISDQDGELARRPPNVVLGQERYSREMLTIFPYHVAGDEDLRRAVAGYCQTLEADQRLAFEGYWQYRDGWRRLVADDLCGAR